MLDQRPLKRISPDAVLMLMAELAFYHFFDWRKQKLCQPPEDPAVLWMLNQVGYFAYFPQIRVTGMPQSRNFLFHLRDRHTHGKKVWQMIEHFENRVTFQQEERQALYDALIESMDNVGQHAYGRRFGWRYHYRDWWLLGYFDDTNHEISFVFLDQGVGIPATIRANIGDQFRSGTDLITEAVLTGKSSTGGLNRGNGLPSLKTFVDRAYNGTLQITSDQSRCTFSKGTGPEKRTLRIPLHGTLITWKIQFGPQ